ncbi:25446_t:CDS:2, partial [Dentiscutata erythropus]
LLSKQLKHELKTYYIAGRLPTKPLNLPQRMESGWGETNSSFIFSMENGKTLENCMISRVTSPERAIWNAPRNPCFSHDLQWFKGKLKQSSYEKKIYDSEEFVMVDIEIYRVVKKNENDNSTEIMEIDNVNN